MYVCGEKESVDYYVSESIKILNKDNSYKNRDYSEKNFNEEDFLKDIKSNGFFSEKKIIIFENPNKDQAKILMKVLPSLEEDKDIIIYIKKYDSIGKADGLINFFKEKNQYLKFNPIKNQYGKEDSDVIDQVRNWLLQKIKDENIEINRDALEYLLESNDYNMRLLSNKLEQIKVLNKKIDFNIMKDLSKDKSKVTSFDLVEAILNRDIPQYYKILDKMFLDGNENINYVLEGLLIKFKFLTLVYETGVSLNSLNANEIVNEIKRTFNEFNNIIINDEDKITFKIPHPYTVKLAVDAISDFPLGHINKMYNNLYSLYEEYRFGTLNDDQIIIKLKHFIIYYSGFFK